MEQLSSQNQAAQTPVSGRSHAEQERTKTRLMMIALISACSLPCPLIEDSEQTQQRKAGSYNCHCNIHINFFHCAWWLSLLRGPPAVAAENNSNRNTSLMMRDTVKNNTVGCWYSGSEHTDNDILYDFLMFAVFTVACATYLIESFI